MKAMTADTLRVDILRKVMELNEDELKEVYSFDNSLLKQEEKVKEYELPEELLQQVADYTDKLIAKGGPFYTTEEVFDEIDKKMGWK